MAETLVPARRPEPVPNTDPLAGNLRQMIAVLERERQALAALDADSLVCAAQDKEALCDALAALGPLGLVDGETRSLAETARQLNDVNRRVRNLLAANVAARIEALGGGRLMPRATYAAMRGPTA
ncbi:flagellar protein FlgN [Erythrobacter sp. WG]|uniref:flagellar protein FlgN n=1 Tax=Erythrobacter sp. WG TaxID=2985510 RepID=UPI002270DE01|nr:flagellar protein FlgN [Erythrobacter sp. WG]MCX9148145.1 flagellar protein FlgN [Erythrobacter sp. WG]